MPSRQKAKVLKRLQQDPKPKPLISSDTNAKSVKQPRYKPPKRYAMHGLHLLGGNPALAPAPSASADAPPPATEAHLDHTTEVDFTPLVPEVKADGSENESSTVRGSVDNSIEVDSEVSGTANIWHQYRI